MTKEANELLDKWLSKFDQKFNEAAEKYGATIHYKGENREWKQRTVGSKTESFLAGQKHAVKIIVEEKLGNEKA